MPESIRGPYSSLSDRRRPQPDGEPALAILAPLGLLDGQTDRLRELDHEYLYIHFLQEFSHPAPASKPFRSQWVTKDHDFPGIVSEPSPSQIQLRGVLDDFGFL